LTHEIERFALVPANEMRDTRPLGVDAGAPKSLESTSSRVTALITSGPVMNMWLLSAVMITKSVRAGEYTDPPAHGPNMTQICGMTPLA